MRTASPDQLARLRWWQQFLDEAFRIPGTRIRFGWDSIIGLVPWAGDVVSGIFGLVILFHAHQMQLPGVVLARMVINLVIDLAIGLVPFAGDIADVFWKANTRNLALLARHATAERPPTTRDWLFVAGVGAGMVALATLPLVLLLAVARLLGLW